MAPKQQKAYFVCFERKSWMEEYDENCYTGCHSREEARDLEEEHEKEARKYDKKGQLLEDGALVVFLDVMEANARAERKWKSMNLVHPGENSDDEDKDDADDTDIEDNEDGNDIRIEMEDGSIHFEQTQYFNIDMDGAELENKLGTRVKVEVKPVIIKGSTASTLVCKSKKKRKM